MFYIYTIDCRNSLHVRFALYSMPGGNIPRGLQTHASLGSGESFIREWHKLEFNFLTPSRTYVRDIHFFPRICGIFRRIYIIRIFENNLNYSYIFQTIYVHVVYFLEFKIYNLQVKTKHLLYLSDQIFPIIIFRSGEKKRLVVIAS